MFYAAMYALKGREDRRAAAALQQMTGVDLGGQPGAPAPLAPRAAPLSWRCSVRCAGPPDPVGPLQLQERPLRGCARALCALLQRGGYLYRRPAVRPRPPRARTAGAR